MLLTEESDRFCSQGSEPGLELVVRLLLWVVVQLLGEGREYFDEKFFLLQDWILSD